MVENTPDAKPPADAAAAPAGPNAGGRFAVVIGWQPGAVFVDTDLQETAAARELGAALRDDPRASGIQIILT